MIQPLNSTQASSWLLYWFDLDDPVPTGDDFMLPTLVMVTDHRGVPVAQPEVFEELDQARAENFLAGLIEKLGAPGRILVGESDEWDERAWRDFSEDFRVPIEFTKVAGRKSEEMQIISQHIVAQFTVGSLPKLQGDPPDLARGLVSTALRVRSERKKIALLKRALESDKNCAEARVELADADFRRSDWSAALDAYNMVIAQEVQRWAGQQPSWWTLDSTRPYLRAIYGRGMTLWHQGQHPAAATALAGLLDINAKDHQGVRFLIPLIWLLAEDYESADRAYAHYAKAYPKDYCEPSFVFGRGLMHSYYGREAEALACYSDAILKNIYTAPMILELPLPPEFIWQPNDRADANFARDFVDSYAVLWDRVPSARRNLREAWETAQSRVQMLVNQRIQMFEFQDQRYEPDYKTIWQTLVAQDERLSS